MNQICLIKNMDPDKWKVYPFRNDKRTFYYVLTRWYYPL